MRRAGTLAAALLVAVLTVAPAHAGGIGVYDMTGFHAGVDAGDPAGGSGTWLDQGGGVEIWIGGKGARLAGRVRVLYNLIRPNEPAERHVALALFGIEGPIVRASARPLGLYGHLDIGPAFLARQHGEFGMADLGLGLHVGLAEHAELVVELSGQMRFQRRIWGGAVLFAGVRFPID